jgi:hypothetical protein
MRPLHLDPTSPPPAEAPLPALAVGVGLTVALHGTLALLVVAAPLWLHRVAEPSAIVIPPPEEEVVIAAQLVRLGRELDPDELPNREVPILPTAPPAPDDAPLTTEDPEAPPTPEEAPSTNEDPPPPAATPDTRRRRPPPEALQRDIDNLLDRAEVFAEEAERRELEGSLDGDPEGRALTATEGQRYAGRVQQFFRRGWSVPTTLPRDVVDGLMAVADVTLTQDLRIASFRIRTPSGNPLFDQSVIDQLTRLQRSGSALDEPPPEVEAQYRGATLGARFRGRQAR